VTLIYQEQDKRDYVSSGKPPATIRWKGHRMVRNHSLRAVAHEIITTLDNNDVVRISLTGDTGTGKTTFVTSLMCLIHRMAKIPFAVRILTANDMVEWDKTIKILAKTPTNYLLFFDDVSFLKASKDQMDDIQRGITVLRHKLQDCKLVIFQAQHYSKATIPYIRSAKFHVWTDIADVDMKNISEMFKGRFDRIAEEYSLICAKANITKKYTIPLGKKHFFSYNVKNPFTVVLFSNKYSCRYVAVPLRTFFAPTCTKCSSSFINESQTSELPIEKWKPDFDKKFPIGSSRLAVKLILWDNGINTFYPKVTRAMKYLRELRDQYVISDDDLVKAYGFEERFSRLRTNKRPNIVLS
jgi:energy-coupling factor transporter ATP-binding protein EcfA2